MHEFGHWLGLQDAYKQPNDWMPINSLRFPLPGVNTSVYPDYHPDRSIMDKGTQTVTDNDIEMVVLAFKTGKRQNYQIQFPWEEVSEAMG